MRPFLDLALSFHERPLTLSQGVSGAGKTSLLDALATRTTMGVLSGEALVDGRPRDASFQRKTGYVQQQDLHLETTTVREALIFSAVLRQPAHLSRKEKVDYVDEVIRLLEMEEYADAVVGVPGEGLNVEQRKRLTIGVELAAKPELLLFLCVLFQTPRLSLMGLQGRADIRPRLADGLGNLRSYGKGARLLHSRSAR